MPVSIKPRMIIGGALAVTILLLLSLTQEMNRRWQVQREVQRLEAEVQSLEKGVIELENLNQYFRTPDFQERLAREKLNYRAPGEQVVLIPEQELPRIEERVSDPVDEGESSLPLLWWQMFFVNEQQAAS